MNKHLVLILGLLNKHRLQLAEMKRNIWETKIFFFNNTFKEYKGLIKLNSVQLLMLQNHFYSLTI